MVPFPVAPERTHPREAIDTLVSVVGKVGEGEIVFVTTIDRDGYVGDSEAFCSPDQSKTTIPTEELFVLAQQQHAPAIILTSRVTGRLDEVAQHDLAFTKSAIDYGRKVGIEVFDHVLVADGGTHRLMSETTALWPRRAH